MARKTRMQPAAGKAAGELEEVTTGGLGIDDGVVLATLILLIGALVLVLVANQGYAPQ